MQDIHQGEKIPETQFISSAAFSQPDVKKRQKKAPGYPLIFLSVSRQMVVSFCVCLGLVGAGLALYFCDVYIWHDMVPGGRIGLTFAIFAFCAFVMAALGYVVQRRRPQKRRIGQLNVGLQWHVALGIISVSFALMHSFGQTQKITGALALYSLCALVISGIFGRFFDRIIPYLIAREVHSVLSRHENDMQSLSVQHTQETFEQEIDISNSFIRTIVQEEEALKREHAYRSILRVWRKVHVVLAIVATGCLCWHLVYAFQKMFFH